MSKHHLLTCSLPTLLLTAGLATGCDHPSPPTDPSSSRAATTGTYDLRIVFDGLIGFVEQDTAQKSRIWALLVDASYPFPGTEQEFKNLSNTELPPCVKDELGGSAAPLQLLENHYPPHTPLLRIQNARIDGSPSIPPAGISLAGKEVAITTSAGSPSIDLGDLCSINQVRTARNDSSVPSFDQVAPKYVVDSWASASDNYLTSRVEIDKKLIGNAVIKANPLGCGGGMKTFQFKTEAKSCGSVNQDLAEDLTVEETLPETTQVRIEIRGTTGAPLVYLLAPQDKNKKLLIEILNVNPKHLGPPELNFKDPNERGCEIGAPHYSSFRWFYRLSKDAPASGCPGQFFPCPGTTGEHGGRKCPQKLFTES